MKKTAVLGIGNILLQDDGIGIRVVEKLKEKGSLPYVDIVDGGTSTLDMLDLFLDNERVVIVDSLKGGYSPGTIYRLKPEQLGSYYSSEISLHDTQVLDLIRLAAMMGKYPEVIIIGVEPKEIKESLELTPEIERVLPLIMDTVEKEVQQIH
ncbi:hydrogenase maturation protease [Thermanaerosceptrum fracticalcis]|uniref:Hydrogenase maturation protease n=1 Tax=Thermanaerosceptrum fracticalcis TaxID=1712410 RepID=A0A7G6E3X5_THEFR|nr:HyaD/HybD family hydrogenase maturation endopeptidase [Thermanaerosceptrum fracticalcis]QNB46779.1 hydrogenase maturation protease [Thermanaerosceptrum fracticalcis]